MSETYRTETQALEERITDALVTIRREWPHMLPVGAPGRPPGGPGRAAGILGDNSPPDYDDTGRPHWKSDHSEAEQDIDPRTRVASRRRHVITTLSGWSRNVVDDRLMPGLEAAGKSDREIREYLTSVLPNGHHVGGMCIFLQRHAQWMSGHEAAEVMADELEESARRVKAVTQPQRREWMSLGSCPLEIEQESDDGSLVMDICGGQVRAWPQHTDEDGQVMARCRRCGEEAVAPWWEARMFDDPELKVMLTDAEVVGFVHRAYGKVIEQATVRQWVKRQVISPSGTVDGRRVFDRHALVWALDLKEKREVLGL